jgi:glycosyltransferase involved in cell wall biosynthesis
MSKSLDIDCGDMPQKIDLPLDTANVPSRSHRISVVIPVYNGEKYLSKTFDSVLSQSYADFEVICIDDCSTDSSGQILQDYAHRDARFRVLKTPKNLGSVSKVLNFAVQYMSGGFFVYSSQDDLFSEDWLEKMHQRWLETGADAVIPKVVMFYEQEPSKNRSLIGLAGDRTAQLSGREALEQALDWRIPGNALWNIEIIKKLGFEEFSANSDEYSVRNFFLHCNNVVFCEGTFFYRQDNDQAITKKKSPNSFDWPYTQLRLAQLLQEYSFSVSLVRREIVSAISAMANLRKWLKANQHVMTTTDLELIHAKIQRFEHMLESRFSRSEALDLNNIPSEVVAKWRRSLEKLPRKIAGLFRLSN